MFGRIVLRRRYGGINSTHAVKKNEPSHLPRPVGHVDRPAADGPGRRMKPTSTRRTLGEKSSCVAWLCARRGRFPGALAGG